VHFRFAGLQRAPAEICSAGVATPLAGRASYQARYVFEGCLVDAIGFMPQCGDVDEDSRNLQSTARRLKPRYASLNTRLLLRTNAFNPAEGNCPDWTAPAETH
jgi:hypothetical protein